MTSFAPSASLPGVAAPDPTKHVNYTLGMILGVDDFTQEFAYLSGRDRWLARDLVGYGTVSGLDVRIEVEGAEGHTVVVTAGSAITPSGQLVCVDSTQCARLNEWLRANRAAVEAEVGTSGESANLHAYVVLSYRARESDRIPIPGDPCRTDDELTAASRLQDSFQLELTTEPPAQDEEDAIVAFVGWLREIEVVGEEPGTELDDFLDWIRGAAMGEASPPEEHPSLEFLHASPPETLAIPRDRVHEYLKAAFRLWTTELRPHARDRVAGCACGCENVREAAADQVLLGELDLRLVWEQEWVTAEGGHAVDGSRRPYVASLRTVQEWLLAGQDVLTGPPGPQGKEGEPGQSVTEVTVGTLAPDVPASAEYDAETGTLHLAVPKGAPGVSVSSVTAETVASGNAAEALFDASTGALTLRIPQGPPGSGVNTVDAETGDPGTDAAVEYDAEERHLHFRIPRGETGAHVTSVTVTTLEPGSSATAEFDAETGALALGIPAGATGPEGRGVTGAGATTVPAEQPATASFDPETGVISFQIPRGSEGPAGPMVDVEPWHEIGAPGEPEFENEWRNFGEGWETAAFYRDPWGRVFVRGLITGGKLGAVAFRLPEGYRPTAGIHLLGNSVFNATDAINVHADGAVFIRESTNVNPEWVSLAHVSFRAEK
jgi:hypothetical protein